MQKWHNAYDSVEVLVKLQGTYISLSIELRFRSSGIRGRDSSASKMKNYGLKDQGSIFGRSVDI